MEYIQSDKNINGCVFCKALELSDGPDNLISFRGEHAFVILNRYPYTSGHLMVVPYDHKSSLVYLSNNTRNEMMALTATCLNVLEEVYHPQGFNVGVNIGEAAGAGILEHVHLHIVPRWVGDTNFMSALGKTRVLPESLEESYQRITEAWKKIVNPKQNQ